MRVSPSILIGLVAAGLLACNDHNSSRLFEPGGMQSAISDAVNNAGNEHFFWLPPMVENPETYNGDFDGSLSPVVDICEWTGTACVLPLVAEFTTTTGPGSETVRVVPTDGHYIVNWHTDEFSVDVTKLYRISVRVEAQELGYADVQMVQSGAQLKNVNTDEYIPLKDGRTLPIKFRIEEGALVIAWAKTYSGSAQDEGAASIRQTPDGGFIVAGWTRSFGAGDFDVWVMKLDATGQPQWERTYGGGSLDIGLQVAVLTDGYLVSTLTFSFGSHPFEEPLYIRLDLNGDVVWQNTYRSTLRDWGRFTPTSDGGFIVAGGEDQGRDGQDEDGRILKLDANGVITDQKLYGGSSGENLQAIRQTTDGGYITVGATASFGVGNGDWWVLKLRPDLAVEWIRTVGGSGNEAAFDVRQTPDEGYVVVGNTRSAGAGGEDAWIIRLDAQGQRLWDRTFGGAGEDVFWSVELTGDGGFIVGGGTTSFGTTGLDAWVLKLRSDGTPEWERTFDTGALDEGQFVSVEPTSDGGYAVASNGNTSCPLCNPRPPGPHRFFVLKLKADGTIGAACPPEVGAAQSSQTSVTSDPGLDWQSSARASSAIANPVSVSISATNATVQTICSS